MMFTRGMVICGLLFAAGVDPGTRDVATTGQAAAGKPLVSTKLSDVAANVIDRSPIAQLAQGPGCPWDCGDNPPDGEVGIVDFLAVLAQWGMAGSSCDFDSGGVGITDFLELLAHWGPCPGEPDPVNFFLDQGLFEDAIAQAGKDQKLEWDFNPHDQPPASEVVVPDPLDINTHANGPSDPWPSAACLDQPPNQINGVFSDVDCGICGGGTQVVADQIVLATAESLDVLKFWGGYFPGDAGGGDPLPDNFTVKIREDDKIDPGQPGVVIRKIPVGPATTRTATGQILFGVREFVYTIDLEPNQDLEPGTYWVEIYNDTTEDPTGDDWFWEVGDLDPVNGLAGSVFSIDPPNDRFEQWTFDPATDMALSIICKGGQILWPPQVDNIQFTSNLAPQGPLDAGNNLAFATSGFSPDVTSDILRVTLLSASLDVISGPPAGDNHTAMAFRITSTLDSQPGTSPVLLHVTVYDKQDVEIGKITIESVNGASDFVGFIIKDTRITIGRVDIWDSNEGFEGITEIWAYRNVPGGDG